MSDEPEPANLTKVAAEYLEDRWKNQRDYFESKAKTNQERFMFMRRPMPISSCLTPIAIFVLILTPNNFAAC